MGGAKLDVGGTGSRTLTWWRLGAIAFVMTTCGPFGIEAAVDSGGAMLTLIVVLVTPLVYVIPQVLMVSELSLMMPSNHGYILWVLRGWGPFPAFFNGYNSVIVNTVDLALYPVLASNYVLRLFARLEWVPPIPDDQVSVDFSDTSYRVALAIRFVLIIIGTFVASLSAANVSSISLVLCAIICTIFVALFCWAIPGINPAEQWTREGGKDTSSGTTDWGAFSAAALWLYTGWNSLGSLAGDVETTESEVAQTDHHTGGGGPLAPETGLDAQHQKDAQATREHHAKHNVDAYYGEGNAIPPEILTEGDRAIDQSGILSQNQTTSTPEPSVAKKGLNNVFVKGLRSALLLGIIMYLMPLLAALTSKVAREKPWSDGFLVDALDLALPNSFWVVICIAIVSQFGLFYSSLVCYSRIVWGLAEVGWLPEILCKLHPSLGTPLAATLAQSAALIPLMFIDFSYLQRLEFTLAAVSYCLTFTAYLRLRYTEPNANRPYTVPGGMPVAWLITATKVVVMVTVAATNISDWVLLGVSVGINVCIGIAYYFGGRKRTKNIEKLVLTEGCIPEPDATRQAIDISDVTLEMGSQRELETPLVSDSLLRDTTQISPSIN